jgi:hypothetical protein
MHSPFYGLDVWSHLASDCEWSFLGLQSCDGITGKTMPERPHELLERLEEAESFAQWLEIFADRPED